MRPRIQIITASLALALAGAGCGGAAPPRSAQADTQAAIRSAQEMGAAESPRASLFLEMAQENVTEAEALIARGDMERAERALERAEADAELAIALARRADRREEASQLRENIQDMRETLL